MAGSDNLAREAQHGVALNFFSRFGQQLLQFVIAVALARLLEPDDFGLIGCTAVFVGIGSVIADGGFGNALIEAFYYRKPLLVNRYSIYITDIEPKGAKVIAMDGYLTKDVVNKVQRIIDDPAYREEMVDYNFEIGKAFFSYSVLRRKLRAIVTNFTGQDNL